MNINKINFQTTGNHSKANSKKTADVSFKGLKTDIFKYAINPNRTNNADFFVPQVAAFLNVRKRDIIPYTKNLNRHKMDLLYKLSEKFNTDTYYNKNVNNENSKKFVFDIYNKINTPQQTHIDLIESTNFSLEQLNKIVDITEKEPQKLKLVDNLLSIYPYKGDKSKLDYSTLEEFLQTKSSQKIASNFDEYKPFIELDVQDKNIVKNLENEIQNGYQKNVYEKKLNIKELFAQKSVISGINPDLIENNYNPAGVALLKNIKKAYSCDLNDKAQDSTVNALMEIYNSATPQNIKPRNEVLNYVRSHIDINKKLEEAPLETISRIFKKIDTDSNARKFVEENVGAKSNFSSIAQLDDALAHADLKRLNSRNDLVQYALLNMENLAEFSKKDFSEVDKLIKKSQLEEKKLLERAFYSPNPIIRDLHRFKMKVNRFFERFTNN